jgi:acetyl esterase/lipase
MNQNARTVEYEGVNVIVKPIPEGGEDGDMDPRIYASMKNLPLMSHFMPKPKKNATPLEQILPYRKMFGEYQGDIIADEGILTSEIKVASNDGYQVPVRVYKRQSAGENLPIMVYIHGGGFFGGGLDIVEQMCKLLVQDIDCVCLSVDYRLCPENHFPQPFDDCMSVIHYAYDHAAELGGNRDQIAVGGDSAGGNLTACLALKDRDDKTNIIKLQILIYPAVNIAGKQTTYYHGTDINKYHKSKKHAKVINAVVGLMNNMMGSDGNMLENVYLQGNLPAESIYASPLLDDFHSVVPTLLTFGEHDMLVFEDFAYAKTATEAGVDLKTIIYRGLGHGFADQIGVMPQAEDLMAETAKRMREVFHLSGEDHAG